ncbi:nicotinamide riboside kinase 1 isoform X2 [Pseudophryne corroboree]|uniref:nicotinamide riboside kinase 1 isoform X2 n=1 Tax=Pseudophryne corroboree TaxID=495146 RepID=UPI00308131E7
MRTFIVGIGGVTNGGKTTLANKLLKILPNCSVISQDDYFKPEAEVATDERGFKQFDVLEALEMESMMSTILSWITQHNEIVVVSEDSNVPDKGENTIHFLIVEGFLLYQYKNLDKLFNRRYFLTVPYEECKRRRSFLRWYRTKRRNSICCLFRYYEMFISVQPEEFLRD